MERLINIDNGGTLTDIVVGSGKDFSFTKTLTTPADLSQCFFNGLTKASEMVFGVEDLASLLQSTRHIRYSSTQGTNALVQGKGPKIGLITDSDILIDEVCQGTTAIDLFDRLVGDRVAVIEAGLGAEETGQQLVAQVNRLTTAGAERLVVAAQDSASEKLYKRAMLQNFPRHLLGSVPVLFASEFTTDALRSRRIWSGIINSFLHPTVERFLYSAENRLRSFKVKNPLLIYRNDGASSRVAKSVALKTYSSGPRGGLEGTRALAEAYGLKHVLMADVGGTTTDVGEVRDSTIAIDRRGTVKGVPISFEMSNVHSSGIGGSSIIAVSNGEITVGPESVGAAPGPACFGFGGQQATITDVNLLLGVLDPNTYLNGEMKLDAKRAKTVVTHTVAEPLGISLEEALIRMERAFAQAMTGSFEHLVQDSDTTTLAAFGGGGPMSACHAARNAGVRQVLIPRLAAVFSAYGISFSDISQSYEVEITDETNPEIELIKFEMQDRAARDMFQEGHQIDECLLEWTVVVENADGSLAYETDLNNKPTPVPEGDQRVMLSLKCTYDLPHPELGNESGGQLSQAVSESSRSVRSSASTVEQIPVYSLDAQQPGASAAGPAIVEGPFFTARVPQGWDLKVSSTGDLLLTDTE